MIKNILNYKLLIAILFLGAGFVSCSDVDDLIDPEYDRLFSPTELKTTIRNKTSVEVKWNAVKNAESYTIQLFEGETPNLEGTPYREVKDITSTTTTVTGLEGETTYTLRVQAVGANITGSKWTSTTIKTDAEQIFYSVNPDDLEATQVTLRWTPGESANTITLTPGNIVYTITASDIASGSATITGLTGETNYTAVMKNGEKTRGTIDFTTPLDLGGAIAVTPEDDLAAKIAEAEAGAVFALYPGTYTIEANITVDKSIGIKAVKPSERPVVKGAIFRLSQGAGLELRDLVLDGTNAADNNQMIIYDEDLTAAYGDASVTNCEISNYVKGIFYVNKKAWINAVIFENCYIYNVECNGGDFIDFRAGIAQTFTFKNNTVDNCAWARDFFRMDAGGATNFPGVTSTITITKNTFNNVSNGTSRRILYIRLGDAAPITFTNNLISNTEGYYTNQTTTNIVTLTNNNYFNAAGFYSSAVDKAWLDTGSYTTLDPKYSNAAEGDFTITNEELIDKGIGNSAL